MIKRKFFYQILIGMGLLGLIGCDKMGSNDIPDPNAYAPSQNLQNGNQGNGVVVPNILKNVKAVSINYAGTTCTDSGGLAHYIAHAVDKEGNPVAGVTLNASLINGIKVLRSRNLGGGTLNGGSPASFDDSDINFVDAGVTTEDRLIILPNSENFEKSYLGNWTIDQVSDHTLMLKEEYNGNSVSPLSYIVGNEKRYLEGVGVAVADIKKSTTLDTNITGEVPFDVVFDRVLSGHTFTIALDVYYKDANGNRHRVGIAKIDSFRGGHYSSSTEKVKIDGQDHKIKLILSVADCGNNPVEPLVGVNIVPQSILIDNSKCSLKVDESDLTTNGNGEITLVIATNNAADSNATDEAGECSVTWEASNRGIYMEY
jgi:hypothetical protein